VLTPVDIENKEFAKSFRGYDAIEVDDFMRTLVADYEKLYRENSSLKEKIAIITETLENYKGMESTMQNAILVAQKTAEDIKRNAHERANTITNEAESKAKSIISSAEKRTMELEKEYSILKKEMNTFKARMNSLLHTYLKLMEEMPQEPQEPEIKSEPVTAPKEEAPKATDTSSENTASKVTSPDYKSNLINAEKRKENKTVQNGNSYAPKKINPLVDELLKKRENGENISGNSENKNI